MQIAALLIFQVAKIGLIHYELYICRRFMGADLDGLTIMLVISIISTLHNSFYTVALESSPNWAAVATAVVGNFVYSIHRLVATLMSPFSAPFLCPLSLSPFSVPFLCPLSLPPFSVPFLCPLSLPPFSVPFLCPLSLSPFSAY